MSLISLLKYADTQRSPYFKPGTDLELFDDYKEEWNALFTTSYSLSTLIDTLEQGKIETDHVRFADSTARDYLHHLTETGIDEELHHEKVMNRERLIAFADADYTTVAAFLGTADPMDIAKETGVDRNIVSSIATNHLDGFSTCSLFRDTCLLS